MRITRQRCLDTLLFVCLLAAQVSAKVSREARKAASEQEKCTNALLRRLDLAVPFCKLVQTKVNVDQAGTNSQTCAPPSILPYLDAFAVCFECEDGQAQRRLSTACNCLPKSTTKTSTTAKKTTRSSTVTSKSTSHPITTVTIRSSITTKKTSQPTTVTSKSTSHHTSSVTVKSSSPTITTTKKTSRATTATSKSTSRSLSSATIESSTTKHFAHSSTRTASASSSSPPPTGFKLRANAPGTSDDKKYALLSLTGSTDFITFAPDISVATSFTLTPDGRLQGPQTPPEFADIDAGSVAETLFFDTAAAIAQGGLTPSICRIVATDSQLVCVTGATTKFYVCEGTELQLHVAAVVPGGCQEITLTAIT